MRGEKEPERDAQVLALLCTDLQISGRGNVRGLVRVQRPRALERVPPRRVMNTELNTGVIKVFELEYPGYTSIRARILVPAQTPLFVNTIPTISHMNTLLPWLLSS